MPADIHCVYCPMGLHEFCTDTLPLGEASGYCSCCCWTKQTIAAQEGGTKGALLGYLMSDEDDEFEGLKRSSTKSGSDMADVLSTGRKRAAEAKPFPENGAVCEWAGLKYAGGGVHPIIGCKGNVLVEKRGMYARHHGPDKSVLNNSDENLHLICVLCHNRWHSKNDAYYGERPPAGAPFIPLPPHNLLPHDPVTRATPMEMIDDAISWATDPDNRKVASLS